MAEDGDYDNVNDDALSEEEKVSEGASAWDVLTRVEQYVACASEKALNLEMLLIRVEDVASDYGALSMEDEDLSDETVGKVFEFDVFSGIFKSEVMSLDDFMASLQVNIVDIGENLLECAPSKEFAAEIEEKMQDAEQSLKRTQDVIADIRKRSDKFENDLAFAGLGTRTVADVEMGISMHSSANATPKQQAEQQRDFLQMLEKSLARELDLEKKLAESKHNEDELRLKLHYAEELTDNLEESMEMVLERTFEAENFSETLLGISKELLGKLQIVQFNLKGSLLRESGLTSNLQGAEEECSLTISETLTLRDKIRALEDQLTESHAQLRIAKASAESSSKQQDILRIELSEMENAVKVLKEDIGKLESRTKIAEEKSARLTETNIELNAQLNLLRSSGTEKADVLESKLKDSDTQLEHARASVEAIEEQQNMLYSALSDMENLIEDLKGKVSKAETRAENAESKCNLLSETNLELNEELGFLRSRLDCMEGSLNQAEDAKMACAKDIGIKTKFITDLVIKLAMERERLQLQISTLIKQNKLLAKKNSETKDSIPDNARRNKIDPETNFNISKSPEEARVGSASTNIQMERSAASIPSSETISETTFEGSLGAGSKLETVRSIEATQLNFTYLLMAVLVLLVSIFAIYLFQLE